MPHQQAAPQLMGPSELAPRPSPRMSHLNSTISKVPSLSQAVQTRMGLFSLAFIRKLTRGTALCSLEIQWHALLYVAGWNQVLHPSAAEVAWSLCWACFYAGCPINNLAEY